MVTDPLSLMGLIPAALGIEFLAVGRRLWQQIGEAGARFAYPRLWVWAQAGFLGGAFSALVSYVSVIAVTFNLVLIPIVFIEPMLDATGPAPGTEWMLGKLSILFLIHPGWFTLLIAVSGAIGALVSSILGWMIALQTHHRLLTRGWSAVKEIHRRLPWLWQVAGALSILGLGLISSRILAAILFLLTAAIFFGILRLINIRIAPSWLWFVAGVLFILGLVSNSPRLMVAGISLGILRLISTRTYLSWLWWAAWGLSVLGLVLKSSRLLAAGISLGIVRLISTHLSLRRVPWPVIGLSFIMCLVGFLLLIYVMDLDVWWQAMLFALFAAPAATLVYRVIASYTGWPPHVARQVTLISLALLAAFLMYSRRGATVVLGGVSRYNGQTWQNYTPDNSFLGGRVRYHIFRDSQGNLWFGGGTGVLISCKNGEWGGFSVESTSSEPGGRPLERRGRVSRFLEDSTGRLWVGIGSKVAQVYEGILSIPAYSPSDPRYGEEGIYEELEFPDQSINAFLEGSDGTLWIGTSGGVTRLKPPPSNQ
jgi:hypothetical protein